MSMMQVMCIMRAYWKHSLITVLSVTIVMAAVIKFMPKSYVATATLMVNYENKDPLAGREFPNGRENTYIPTQIELIMSPVVLQPVVDRLQLTSDPEFTRGSAGAPDALREAVVRNLRDALQVQQGKGSQLLYVAASAKWPGQAADIANAVADQYLTQERQRTNEPAGERAARYSRQLAELRAKAIAATDRVTEFRRQHGMTDVEADKGDVEVIALKELEQKLLAAQNQRRELEARQLSAHAVSDEVLDANAVQELRAKLVNQESEMAQLRATLGARHPKVLELQSQMAATRSSLATEVKSISANNSAQLARARGLEAKYQSAVDDQRAKVLARQSLQDQGAKLVLELQSAQATYKHALDGYDQIVFASAGNYTDVSLISRADPPVKADKPNKVKYFLMSCLAALGLGLGWPFAYELLLNRRLRCRDDLERHFGIQVLAQFGPIPHALRSSSAGRT
jgi:uncharacterized protein involved in exopolysaccharide biosynthesis